MNSPKPDPDPTVDSEIINDSDPKADSDPDLTVESDPGPKAESDPDPRADSNSSPAAARPWLSDMAHDQFMKSLVAFYAERR